MPEGHELVSIASSNLPADAKKSVLMRYWEGLKGGGIKRVESAAVEGGQALRASGEGLIVGGILGLVHSAKGLDNVIDDAPLDGIIGLAGIAAAMAVPSVGPDARNVSAAGFAILGFRKVHDWAHERAAAKGEAVGSKIEKPKLTGKTKVAGELHGFALGGHQGQPDGVEIMSDGMLGEDDPIVEIAKRLG